MVRAAHVTGSPKRRARDSGHLCHEMPRGHQSCRFDFIYGLTPKHARFRRSLGGRRAQPVRQGRAIPRVGRTEGEVLQCKADALQAAPLGACMREHGRCIKCSGAPATHAKPPFELELRRGPSPAACMRPNPCVRPPLAVRLPGGPGGGEGRLPPAGLQRWCEAQRLRLHSTCACSARGGRCASDAAVRRAHLRHNCTPRVHRGGGGRL